MTEPPIRPGEPGRWSRYAPEGQRRRRRTLAIVSAVVGTLCVLCCCGAGATLATSGVLLDKLGSGPYEDADRLMAAIRDRDSATVYDRLCAAKKETITRESVEQQIAEIPRFTSFKWNHAGASRRSHKGMDGLRHHFIRYDLYDGRREVGMLAIDLADVDEDTWTDNWKLCGAPLE